MNSALSKWAGRLFDLQRRDKQILQALSDACMLSVALLLALLANGYAISELMIALSALVTCATVMLLILSGAYRAVVRYLSFGVSPRVLVAILGGMVTLELLLVIYDIGLKQRVVLDFGLMSAVLVSMPRHVMRWVYESIQMKGRERVLIYGAGGAGRQLAMALRSNAKYDLVGFVDDDPALDRAHILSLPVRGPDYIDTWARSGIRHILLALPNVSAARRREIIGSLEHLGVSIQTVPDMGDLVSGRAKLSELRRVDVADLLGREAVPPIPALIRQDVSGKVVMVTGAGGSIGSELCRQILQYQPRALILLERSEHALYVINAELEEQCAALRCTSLIVPALGSVCSAARVRSLLHKHAVDTVYHAAAFKHVPLVEGNAFAAIENNVIGTWETALAAAEHGVGNFVLVSTDKAVRPTNVMGATKRLAELSVQALAQKYATTRFSIVRFGNVLGSSGSVVPLFRSQIESGGPVTVTHPDIIRYFMTIPEASQLVIQAGAMGARGEVFVLDMGEPVNIASLAERMIRLSGFKPRTDDQPGGDIEIRYTGLRPGEKLYEELLLSEDARSTQHPRIYQSQEPALSLPQWTQLLEQLNTALQTMDLALARTLFLSAPLEYQPAGDTFSDVAVGASQSAVVTPLSSRFSA